MGARKQGLIVADLAEPGWAFFVFVQRSSSWQNSIACIECAGAAGRLQRPRCRRCSARAAGAAQPRRLCPSSGAGAQHPRREETISFAPQQRLVQPYPPALSLTHSTINAGRAPPGRVRQQSSAAFTRSLCCSVSAPAPAGGRTLRAAREQRRTGAAPASAAAAVGRTGPHVACTARQIPCQIANKIYRRLS